MAQETRVFEIAERPARELKSALQQALPPTAEWRVPPHARFWLKAEGVVLTVYQSGKAVLQGDSASLDEFCARYLTGAPGLPPVAAGAPKRRELETLDVPTLGSDESGKGDYFGPLVVAAAFARPEDAERLREIGVLDSKLLSDARMQAQVGQLEKSCDHEVRALMPEDYNRAIADGGNANTVLAGLHAEVLGRLLARHPDARRTVVDRFSATDVLERAIAARRFVAPGLDLRPGAEKHPVVAAASILARVHFVEGLQRCADECGTDLHKGAGAPVDEAAARVVAIGGKVLLAKVAKLHFRNTGKIRGL